MRSFSLFLLFAVLAFFSASPAFAQQSGSISGVVQDSLGAVIVGATVTVVSADAKEKTTTSNQRGEFSVTGLAPGKYTVKVIAPKFALYENTEVVVTAGKREELTVPLTVEAVAEQVQVDTDPGVSTDPDATAGATVIKGKDLEALPDDPDELAAALQALAGPSAGPNGGQIYIDGFTGGQLPPKDAIREIRVNQNPFSAEFDRLGFGRIEILTKPGSDKFRGNAFASFNDESLNSRNPFSANRAPSQTRNFGGNFSGPIKKGKSSFFFDINSRSNDENAVINAFVLDENLNVVPFNQEVVVPTRRFSFSPRFDYQINKNNTLVLRYSFNNATLENQGLNGGLTLPSRAYDSTQQNHEFRLTETMIINPTTVNETRFSYEHRERDQIGDNSIPALSVGAAFIGGGATIGESFNHANAWEVQNYTTTILGKSAQHSLKFGARIRGTTYDDQSENNFGGSFTFPGIPPRLADPSCVSTPTQPCALTPSLTGIEQYQNTILQTAGFAPTQFSITTGNPLQHVSQYDYGVFFTDDWRVNPGLTLSFGLRYENQTNISDNMNFAPRFAFAWSPGAGAGARAPKTVIRGGFGVFYERVNDNYTLQALRFNGVEQQNLVVSSTDPDPARRLIAINLLRQPIFTVDGVTNVPTAADIQAVLPQSNTPRQMAADMQAPYYYQFAVSVERQLPGRTVLSGSYIATKNYNTIRSVNINAPICPNQIGCLTAPRPFPTLGNIQEFESTGLGSMQQFVLNFRTNFNPRVSLFGNYALGFANNDTDGGFPAYSYDLSDEYGRSSQDVRHRFIIGGNINLPWSISLSPFINAFTGRPFNITRGVDTNSDAQVTERPTFAELGVRCNQLGLTSKSFCDVSGQDP
ncbi:MAG: carboxypeptidase regulatory-like domain-containing protein, partial [Pyrinomonadaceae bacterium]